MVRLLKIQQEELSKSDDLTAFSISLLCSLLDIFESDIEPDEMVEIKQFCNAWAKND